MTYDTDYSIEGVVKNGLDILEVVDSEEAIRMSVKFAHSLFVQYLNDNGHPEASQALDDLWVSREDQWYRDGKFYERYLHGEELLRAIENGKDV